MNALTPMRRAVWVIESPQGIAEEICHDREHAELTIAERYPHGWCAARYTRDAVGDDLDPGAAHEPVDEMEEF